MFQTNGPTFLARAVQFWTKVTTPDPQVQDVEIRQQARLLASLLLAALIAAIVLSPTPALINHTALLGDPQFHTALISVTVIFMAYRLCRHGQIRFATAVTILLGTVIVFIPALTTGGRIGITSLYYLVIMVVFGGLALPVQWNILLCAGQMAAMIVLQPLMVDLQLDEIVTGPLSFNLFLSSVILLVTYHRQRVELERRGQLAQSENRYRLISELMSDYAYSVIVEPDQTLTHEWLTEVPFQRVTGYSREELDEAGKVGMQLIHPDDVPAVERSLQRLYKGEETDDEYRIITRSGEVRWLHILRKPVWDSEAKRVARFYGVAEDITERKKAEEALRQSEERYRLLAANLPESAVILFDHDLRMVLVDGPEVTRMGYSKTMTEGKKPSEALPLEFARVAEANMSQVLEGRVFSAEIPLQDQIHQYHYFPLRDSAGRVIYGLIMARNITAQRAAEEALRQSEERYRVISELISDYAYAYDVAPDGTLIPVWLTHDSFTRLTGYTWDEIGGGFGLYHPDDAERAKADVARTLTGDVSQSEYRIHTKSGQMRWISIYRQVVWDPEQKRVVRFYGVAQDITERKAAEAEALRAALERERIGLVNEFTLAFSHDFRTSLATIETSRYLIERLVEESARERIKPKLDTIQGSVHHLNEQLENLHMVTALTQAEIGECNLNLMIEGIGAEFNFKARQKKLTISVQTEIGLRPLQVDEKKLRLAVAQLMHNAITHTPEGGHITVSTHQDSGEVRIEVQDSGHGIDPENQPHIFDFFYRADDSRRVASGGVGLGLSIVKMVAEAHGGRVELSSTIGAGSTFSIVLPLPGLERDGR